MFQANLTKTSPSHAFGSPYEHFKMQYIGEQ